MRITGFMKKVVSTVAMSALVIGALVGTGAAPAQAAKPVNSYTMADRCLASWDTKLGGEILKSLNSYRASKGIKPVKEDYLLLDWASYWTVEMASNDYFEHYPRNEWFLSEFDEVGMSGENIALRRANNSTAKSFMDGWKKSPGHNANMLNSDWKSVGIALHKSPKTGNVYATMFLAENLNHPIPNRLKSPECQAYAKKKSDLSAAKKKYAQAQKYYKTADKTADKTLKTLKQQKPKKPGKAWKAYQGLKKVEKATRSANKAPSTLKSAKALEKQAKTLRAKTKILKQKTTTAKKYIKKTKK